MGYPYVRPMNYLARMSPLRAIRDLRFFLASRERYELGFLALSVVITALILAAFVHDSHEEKVYRREIIYVQNWPASRTDEQVRAQQAIDAPKERARKEAIAKRQRERQESFKRLDDKLERMGL